MMAGFIKKHLVSMILYVILLIGLGLLLYPGASNWRSTSQQGRIIDSYVEEVENMTGEAAKVMMEDARNYNRWLAAGETDFLLIEEDKALYESFLDVSGTGIMGYLEIPKINVNLPICHDTDDEVLKTAVGHIPGSSLPIGGESTHSVLSGHRGLPSAKLLTDLDQMQEGDLFTITVLNQVITYEVDQIRIVEPEDVSELQIYPGEDYCTLLTCTPYGINTHRLLVRGRRTGNIASTADLNTEAVRILPHFVILIVGIPMIFVLLLVLLICYPHRKPSMTEEELLNELKKLSRKEEGEKAHEK